jgi:hypothetical protein
MTARRRLILETLASRQLLTNAPPVLADYTNSPRIKS